MYRVNNFWAEGISDKDKELYEQQFATQAISTAETLNPGKGTSQTSTLYVGEQSVPKMMAVDPSLRLTMDYGFFWMVSNGLHKFLRLIHDYLPNWSVSLIFLVALVRLAMFPSMKQQSIQTKKMKAMAPEKEIIEKRYENDKWNPQRFEALSALHKKHGINSMSISMLIPLLQIPLMIAFFNMVQVAVEFRAEPFLWISDMSQRDPYYIMPVLASLMMVLHFSGQKDNGMNEDFKMIFRVMPLVMLFISFKWPAVVCLYLVTNTMLFALQDMVFSKK
jgi:YidC/Oxa1 family membrane protein insertase